MNLYRKDKEYIAALMSDQVDEHEPKRPPPTNSSGASSTIPASPAVSLHTEETQPQTTAETAMSPAERIGQVLGDLFSTISPNNPAGSDAIRGLFSDLGTALNTPDEPSLPTVPVDTIMPPRNESLADIVRDAIPTVGVEADVLTRVMQGDQAAAEEYRAFKRATFEAQLELEIKTLQNKKLTEIMSRFFAGMGLAPPIPPPTPVSEHVD